MFNLKIFICHFTLIILAFELFEPSTNFVRISNSKSLFEFNWTSKQQTNQHSESNSNQSSQLKINTPVYSCQIIEYFTIQPPQFFNFVGSSTILPLKNQTDLEVFIPPKITTHS